MKKKPSKFSYIDHISEMHIYFYTGKLKSLNNYRTDLFKTFANEKKTSQFSITL